MTNVNTTIAQLPPVTSVTGAELMVLDQGGTTKSATLAQVASFPQTGAAFVMVGATSGFAAARQIAVGAALTLTDGGAGSTITIGTSAFTGDVTTSANSFATTIVQVRNTAVGASTGAIIFGGATFLTSDDAKFHWDDTNFRLGIGTNAPDTALNINRNTGATVAPTADGIHLVGADSTQIGTTVDVFNTNPLNHIRRAQGTRAAKTAIVTGNLIGGTNFQGWDGAAYASGATIQVTAAENWAAATNRGAYIQFFAVPTGSAAQTEVVRFTGTNALFNTRATITPATSGSDALTINPTASTSDRGIVVTQSGPSSNITGPASFNDFAITNPTRSTTAGFANGLPNNWIDGLHVTMTMGTQAGTNTFTGALHGEARITSAVSNATSYAVFGSVYISAANANAGAGLNAVGAYAVADTGASIGVMSGFQTDSGIIGTGVVQYRSGLTLDSVGTKVGATLDAAIFITTYIGWNGSTNAGAFGNLIAFSQAGGAMGTGIPLQTTASFFISDAAMTVANIFNCSNVTVSSNILNFPNAQLSGAGTSTWPIVAGGSAAGSTLTLRSTTNGAPAADTISMITGGATHVFISSSGSIGMIKETNPQAGGLTICLNTTTGIAGSTANANTPLRMIGIDGANSVFEFMTFGSGTAAILGTNAAGTAGSPTQTNSGTVPLQIQAKGRDDAGNYQFLSAIQLVSVGNTSTTNRGGLVQILTTATNTTSLATTAVFFGSGGLSIGSTNSATDPGKGGYLCSFLDTKVASTLTSSVGTMSSSDSAIIVNPSTTFTLTLQNSSQNGGRWLYIKNIAAAGYAVNSSLSIVQPLGSTTPGTAILSSGTNKWSMLQADGTGNWVTMASN